MKQEQVTSISNISWLGRLVIVKPKKGEKIGIPYKSWHHLAIIGNVVFTYVWDTREITDAYLLSTLSDSFETVKVNDNGKALLIAGDTTERAKKQVDALLQSYPELPIINASAGSVLNLKSIRTKAEDIAMDAELVNFDLHDDASVVFVDKNAKVPDNLYMFTEQTTMNPDKRKFADNNAYQGIAKYFAILARYAILEDWNKLIEADDK